MEIILVSKENLMLISNIPKKKSKQYFKHILKLKICEIYLLKGNK